MAVSECIYSGGGGNTASFIFKLLNDSNYPTAQVDKAIIEALGFTKIKCTGGTSSAKVAYFTYDNKADEGHDLSSGSYVDLPLTDNHFTGLYFISQNSNGTYANYELAV